MTLQRPPVEPLCDTTAPRRAAHGWVEILGVSFLVVSFIGALWTVRGELGMTWDEPYFFERQYDVRDWLTRVCGPAAQRREALSPAGLERSWRVCRAVPDQHPPLPEWLSLITGAAFEEWIGPLRAYRLSTVLVFAVAAGVMYRFVRLRWGTLPALAALGGLLFNPRIFADAQQITADSDLGAFWFLSAVALVDSCETGRKPWRFGALAGLAIMCKVTGVLALLAAVLWALLYRPRGAWRPILWGVVLVPVTMIAVNPGWWRAPVAGMIRWAKSFLNYPARVPTYYLGQVYDSVHTFLPWHNTAVLTVTMVPVGLLVLALVGLSVAGWTGVTGWGTSVADSERNPPARLADRAVAGWAAVNFLTLMGMRMLRFMPAHDGLRQLVPAFFFFAILVGYGTSVLVRAPQRVRRGVGRVLVLLGIGSAAWETVSIHPFELAYYSPLIGGPRGAKAAGMETGYFWDAATTDVLGWMNANLPPGATVLIFPPGEMHTFAWEQRWGHLRSDILLINMDGRKYREQRARLYSTDPCYVIFLMRQGVFRPRRRSDSSPFMRLADSPAIFEQAPARVGVRLLAIFDQAQFRAADELSRR